MKYDLKKTKFDRNGLKEIHVFENGIAYPVLIAIYNDWEKTQLSYLTRQKLKRTTISLCEWCESHRIQYQVKYPFSRFFLSPLRILDYLLLKRYLKRYKFSSTNKVNTKNKGLPPQL